tara:strand:- start:80 stop:535 length:456 start_codon:yes stop_codon:yes gene_type:complete
MNQPNHWIIRVHDGVNLMNSIDKHTWGFLEKFKGTYNKMQKGDVLWFLTSKPFGNKLIMVSELDDKIDRRKEQLLKIYTYSNEELGWATQTKWDLQITYSNPIKIENLNYQIQLGQSPYPIRLFEDNKSKIDYNLPKEYELIKKYKDVYNV